MPITAAPTVRESIEAATETVMAPDEPVVDTAAPVETAPVVEAPVVAEAPKEDGRVRNSDGTFAKVDEKAKPKEAPKVEAAAPAVPAAPVKPKTPMPSSWKKELAPHWDTLDPNVQANIIEREKQYATGVSTYKGEADRAKTITQALSQFEPMLQKKGIPTDKWIQQMGIAHYLISEGSPQERVEAVAKIISNNGIDVTALGQLLSGQQPQYQQPQARTPYPQPQQPPVNIDAAVEQVLQKKEVETAYKAFTADVEAGKYPHFADDEVKGTMAGLLQAGLAQDYAGAYEAALAMPKHKHLAAPAPTAPAPVVPDPAAAKQAQAARARSQAVSVKSSTPSAMTQPTGKRSLRDEISASVDTVLGGNRV